MKIHFIVTLCYEIMLQLCSNESFIPNVKVNIMLLLCWVGMGLVCMSSECFTVPKIQIIFLNHLNCHFWLVGGLWVRAETVDKLEACFHGLHLFQQVGGARFFSWRLGGQFRRGGWKRKLEFGWWSTFLTWGHHRSDNVLTEGQNRGDFCPGAREASRVLISAFPLWGWRSGDCVGRTGPDKRRVN